MISATPILTEVTALDKEKKKKKKNTIREYGEMGKGNLRSGSKLQSPDHARTQMAHANNPL